MHANPVSRASSKLQAPSSKLQAPSSKLQAPSVLSPRPGFAGRGAGGEGSSLATDLLAESLPHWRELLSDEARATGEFAEHHGKPCFLNADVACPEADEWDRHWQGLKGTLRGRLFSLYRWQIRSRCVARNIARHFTAPGVYVECGCGSSETSCRIRPKSGQSFLALDFAARPLGMALHQPCHAGGIQADIRRLPFRDQSLDGLWNLGVMEHFEEDDQLSILKEFRRVLKPGGTVLLWWPPRGGLDRMLLGSVGWPFPSEPGRVCVSQAQERLTLSGFREISIHLPASDGWTELAIVGRV